jgi:hypothetical protein
VRLAKPEGSDEVEQLPGSGRLLYGSRCHRRRSPSWSWTALKDRAAASIFKARSPHRSSCSRRARKERRPSTEIRLGVDSALGARELSPTFFVLGKAFASERAPPERCQEESVGIPHPRLTRGAFTDKEPTRGRYGHLPHHTLRYGRRLLPLPSAKGTKHPGPDASLSPSEVITLAIFARWARFGSERDFYRYASPRLLGAFPSLPERSQFNRSVRHSLGLIEEIALHLAELMEPQRCPYQALDSSAMPLLGMPSAGVKDGWLVVQTLDGPIAWDGRRVFVCSWPQIPRASSRVLASVPLRPPTSR